MFLHSDPPWVRINDSPSDTPLELTPKARNRLKHYHIDGDRYALTTGEVLEIVRPSKMPTPAAQPPEMAWHREPALARRAVAEYGTTAVHTLPSAVIPYVKSRDLTIKARLEQIERARNSCQQRGWRAIDLVTLMLDMLCEGSAFPAGTLLETSDHSEQRVFAGDAAVWMGGAPTRAGVAHWNWQGRNKYANGQTQAEMRQYESAYRARRQQILRQFPVEMRVNPLSGAIYQQIPAEGHRALFEAALAPPTSIKTRRCRLGGSSSTHGQFRASAPRRALNEWLHAYVWPTAQEPINRFLSYVWMYWHAPDQRVILPVAVKLRAYATGEHWMDVWHRFHSTHPGQRPMLRVDAPELGGTFPATRPHEGLVRSVL